MITKQTTVRGRPRRLTLTLALCFAACIAHAAPEPDYYWVMGSYRIRSNAEAEQRRLADLLDRRVFLYRVDNLDVWRVSVAAKDLRRAELEEKNIEAWKTSLDLDAIAALPSFRRDGELPTPPPAETWLKEGESIIEWCERMNARAVGEAKCSKQDLDRLRLLAETVAEQSRLLEVRCRDADSAEEIHICEEWRQTRLNAESVQ